MAKCAFESCKISGDQRINEHKIGYWVWRSQLGIQQAQWRRRDPQLEVEDKDKDQAPPKLWLCACKEPVTKDSLIEFATRTPCSGHANRNCY